MPGPADVAAQLGVRTVRRPSAHAVPEDAAVVRRAEPDVGSLRQGDDGARLVVLDAAVSAAQGVDAALARLALGVGRAGTEGTLQYLSPVISWVLGRCNLPRVFQHTRGHQERCKVE